MMVGDVSGRVALKSSIYLFYLTLYYSITYPYIYLFFIFFFFYIL
jgi:hypothetical protein